MFSASLHLSLSCSTNPQLWSKSLSLYPSCQYGCQRFCNFCTLMIEKRDKQNTSNTLLIVGVWKYNVVCITAPISVLLPIPIFALTHCLSTHPANMGVNGFAICVCPRLKKETNRILLTLCLELEYGIIMFSASLHLSLSCSTNPQLWSKSLSLYPSCQYGCQQFCNCCTLMIEKRDKQNASNSLLRVGVWKYNVGTAPISVLLPIPIFALTHCLSTHPANMGVNGFAICVCPRLKKETNRILLTLCL